MTPATNNSSIGDNNGQALPILSDVNIDLRNAMKAFLQVLHKLENIGPGAPEVPTTVPVNTDSYTDNNLSEEERLLARYVVWQTREEIFAEMAESPEPTPIFAALRGVSTNLQYLPGLSVVAGTPSSGKTSVIAEQCKDWLHDPNLKGKILVWSCEVSRAQMWSKILGNVAMSKSGRVLHSARRGEIPADIWAAAECDVERLAIIDEEISALELCKIASTIAAEPDGLLALVVDFIQELPAVPIDHHYAARLANNRELEVGYVAKLLRAFGVSHGVPVLAAAQFNRSVGKHSNYVPELQQLRESGRIEQNASLVIGLRNEEMAGFPEPPSHKNASPAIEKTYRWGDDLENDRVGAQMAVRREHEGEVWRLLEAFVLKNRYEGGVGTVIPMAFHPESGRIEPVHVRLIASKSSKSIKKIDLGIAVMPAELVTDDIDDEDDDDGDDDLFAPA